MYAKDVDRRTSRLPPCAHQYCTSIQQQYTRQSLNDGVLFIDIPFFSVFLQQSWTKPIWHSLRSDPTRPDTAANQLCSLVLHTIKAGRIKSDTQITNINVHVCICVCMLDSGLAKSQLLVMMATKSNTGNVNGHIVICNKWEPGYAICA